jgi:signal transduction histidine kinase
VRTPRREDFALATALAVVGTGEIIADGSASTFRSVALLAALCVAIIGRERRPAGSAALAGSILAASAAMGSVSYPLAVITAVVALAYSSGAGAPPVRGVAGALALLAGAEVAAFPRGAWVPLAICTVAPFLGGRVVRGRRELVESLRRLNDDLRVEHVRLAELAVRRERMRVARELHDAIAHHLTVITLQAGAGRLTGAREYLAVIRESGRLALAEMDVIGAVISPLEDSVGAASVRTTIGQARAAGLDVRATIDENARLSLDIELLSCRVVQEGLTNAIRHAPGARVDVRIHGRADVQIEILNAAATRSPALAELGSGSGLIGLRARVEAAGGHLEHAVLEGGGWRLAACLPVPASDAKGVPRTSLTPWEELRFATRDDDRTPWA